MPKQYILKTITKAKNITKYQQQKKKEATKLPASLQKHNKASSKTNKMQQSIFPSFLPLQEDTGKSGLMWPRGRIATSHPAAQILNTYSTKGCAVEMNNNWTLEHILQALKRGPHISAKQPAAKQHLLQETKMKIEQGYMSKVKWGEIKTQCPINLKISPLAMIPHKSRSYRCILDLSFQLRKNRNLLPSVNMETKPKAPHKSMAQLGIVIRRIIYAMADNYNKNAPFVFSKCDIKDGFWRMVVSLMDSWNFAYTLPSSTKLKNLDDIEIIVPHALQMGWSESPPYFCAATETGRDVIQSYYEGSNQIPKHPLEQHLTTKLANQKQHQKPTCNYTAFEVYVDDYITITNNTDETHITRLARAMLHGIHSIFPPPSVTGHSGGDPISLKKLLQNEGMFDHKKEILGWNFNGRDFTIELPPEKQQKIFEILQKTKKLTTIPHKTLEKIQGKLVHASVGIPNGRGLLSPLYKAVAQKLSPTPMTQNLKQCLTDWQTLIKLIGSRPTSVLEIVPRDPTYIGYVDASGTAVGGVWTSGTSTIQPTVWWVEWPMEIQTELVSRTNPNGKISINDLETAGILLAWLVLEKIAPTTLKHKHIGLHCDNNAAVNWIQRKSTATSTIAGHLLRAIALRLHTHKTGPLQVIHIPGKDNTMADVASRSFHNSNLTHPQSFLHNFSKQFPLKQNYWKEYQLPNKTFSKVTSSLLGQLSTMALWTKITKQDKSIGLTGKTTPPPSTLDPAWKHAQTQKKSSSSQVLLHGSGRAILAEEGLSGFKALQQRWQPYQRQSNWLANLRQSTKQKKHTNSQWHGSLKVTDEKILLQHHSLPSQSLSQNNASNLGTNPTTLT